MGFGRWEMYRMRQTSTSSYKYAGKNILFVINSFNNVIHFNSKHIPGTQYF